MIQKVFGTAAIVCAALTVMSTTATATEKAKPAKKEETKKMSDLKVNPHGKVFVDMDKAIRIEMAVVEGKNEYGLQDVLMKITGAEAVSEGVEGKTMLYKAEPAGTGYNLTYMYEGAPANRMISRDSWGSWKMFEAFVGNGTFKVYVDDKAAGSVNTTAMLTAYKNGK